MYNVYTIFMFAFVQTSVGFILGPYTDSDNCNRKHVTIAELRAIFIGRCVDFQTSLHPDQLCSDGFKNCTDLWMKFSMAFRDKPQCDVPANLYADFIKAANHAITGKQLFYSGVYELAQRYSAKGKRYTTVENTLIGYLVDRLSFCGGIASNNPSQPCESWNPVTCPYTASGSFWESSSANFAGHAVGDVYVLLNATRNPIFKNSSYFTKYEVPNLRSGKVTKLTATLINDSPLTKRLWLIMDVLSSPDKCVPPKKRKLTFSADICCFCKKGFIQNNYKTTLDPAKFESLLYVCTNRNDEISSNIVASQEKIRTGELEIAYHKACRSKFLHPFYTTKSVPEETNGQEATPSKLTRSQINCYNFSWKEMCFICGEKCSVKHRSKWSMIEGSIDENSKLYTKLLNISAANGDYALHSRLLSSNGDLVAVEARYHRKKKGCLATYLSDQHIKVKSKSKNEIDIVCEYFKYEMFDSVEIKKNVYYLSNIKLQIQEIAESKNMTIEIVSGKQIKRVLKRIWPELRFISRSGLTDLVCSSSLGIDDALCKADKLEKNLEAVQEQNDLESSLTEHFEQSEEHDLSVLNTAALILRNRLMKSTVSLENEYFSSSEINLQSQKQFLDPHLMLFVKWLSGDTNETNIDDVTLNQNVLSLCSDITYLVKPVITPKHLGLSVYLHHSYGSKRLIEDLHAHGYTLSYSEVRHFLTSAALHMSSVQNKTPSDGLVPSELKQTGESEENIAGDLIIAAADNWDHNENTLSGKRSTHAMTSILMQTSQPEQDLSVRIPRVQERSIEISSLPGRGLAHTLAYQKPERRPNPMLQPPVQLNELSRPEPEEARLLRLKELLYTIGRHTLLGLCDDRAVTDTEFPIWTVFQTLVQSDTISENVNVVFNPIIMAPPNDLNTVYTVLKRTKEQMIALGQNVCPIVFDMGLLSKALEIVWANPSEFDGVYPIEGGMHFMMSVFGGIGYIYGDIGLKQMLVESDVFARTTADHILSGKDFDRALRALIMVDEVLNQRFFSQFLKWIEASSTPILPDMLDKLKHLEVDALNNDAEIQRLCNDMKSEILPLVEAFRLEGRATSPLFKLWDDYLTEVSSPMKLYLTSSRHGLWKSHLYAKTKLLPFLFASHRTVYSRFMPYMVLQNYRFPDGLAKKFEEGKFVAKLTKGSFNSVWYDYILEVSENKALKSSGGIIGLTHNDSALTRWFLARPITAKYAMTYSSSMSPSSNKHHTDTPFHKEAYNTAIRKMLSLFESDTFIDPFSLSFPPSKLVNIASGVQVPSDVETSLLDCHKTGKQSLDKFVIDRLVVGEKESPSKNFFDPLPKSKVITVGSTKSKGRPKSSTVPIDGEEMYLRLLAINSFKKVPLDRVLSFENAPVPLSLFTDDGSFMSTKKSDFMEKLESLTNSEKVVINELSANDCFIFDAMAVVQMLQPQSGIKTTYKMMAASFWSYILSNRNGSSQVHVVFDRYISGSLKTQTRQHRGENVSASGPFTIQPNMVIGDWKRVLSSTKSKCELTKLYTRYLTESCHELLDDETTIYVAGGLGDLALKVRHSSVEYVRALESDHEEADSRMILHLAYAASLGAEQAVVFSPDTDVLVLLIHFFSRLNINFIFFKTGRRSIYRDLTRYIPVHTISNSLDPHQVHILLSVYCLTGCDTCSSLHGIGKKKAYQVMCKSADELGDLAELGTQPIMTPNVKAAALKFVGLLYGYGHCTSLDALRTIFVLRKKKIRPRKLPPTNDSFILHVLRCIYQLSIWRSALNATVSKLDPLDFGYCKESQTGLYVPQFMAQAVAPPELLSDLICTCTDLCTDECVCSCNEQPCTEACSCKGNLHVQGNICENLFTMLAHVETCTELEDECLM